MEVNDDLDLRWAGVYPLQREAVEECFHDLIVSCLAHAVTGEEESDADLCLHFGDWDDGVFRTIVMYRVFEMPDICEFVGDMADGSQKIADQKAIIVAMSFMDTDNPIVKAIDALVYPCRSVEHGSAVIRAVDLLTEIEGRIEPH